MPVRLANLSGENLNVKTFRAPIKTQAIPTPIRVLPQNAVVKDPPNAKRKAPSAPINGKEVTTIRGPIRSSIGPIGI
jgi:hypothetical protein